MNCRVTDLTFSVDICTFIHEPFIIARMRCPYGSVL